MSQRSGFLRLFSPYGWFEVLEVTAQVSQLTGPCSEGGTTPFLAWLSKFGEEKDFFLFNNTRALINRRKKKVGKIAKMDKY